MDLVKIVSDNTKKSVNFWGNMKPPSNASTKCLSLSMIIKTINLKRDSLNDAFIVRRTLGLSVKYLMGTNENNLVRMLVNVISICIL